MSRNVVLIFPSVFASTFPYYYHLALVCTFVTIDELIFTLLFGGGTGI
jgi:hypothetical protein